MFPQMANPENVDDHTHDENCPACAAGQWLMRGRFLVEIDKEMMREEPPTDDEGYPFEPEDGQILEAVRRGLDDVANGRVISREEFFRRFMDDDDAEFDDAAGFFPVDRGTVQ